MCNIAGYVGTKQASPILIEMIKRQEYLDGGLSTGIATIHEGKLYFAKVKGNADELIKKTDALNFPGTVGIIHSRPDDNYLEFAHPFLSEDRKTALVLNGNACTDEYLIKQRNSQVRYLHEVCHMSFDSVTKLPRSTFPQLSDGRYVAFGEVMAKTVEQIRNDTNCDYDKALSEAASKLFADVVNVLVSANSPGSLYVTRISRPMNIMKTSDGCYIATSQFGFPDTEFKYMQSLPQMTSCVINKNGFTDTGYTVTGGTVTDFTEEEYAQIKSGLKKRLSEGEHSMDDLGGGLFKADRKADKLRPNTKLAYNILWDFYKEGILKTKIKDSSLPWLPGKTIKRIFFNI